MRSMLVKKTLVREIPDLSARIKESQARSGKTIEAICRECKISRQTWYNIENGYVKHGISWDILQKIEKALGVDFGVRFD